MIENGYQAFDAQRKSEEAMKADKEDLNDLKVFEQELKSRRK